MAEDRIRNKSAKHRRTNFLINPEFQLRFLAFQLVSSLITVAVFFFANNYFFNKMAETGKTVGLHEGHIFFKFIAQQEQTMSWIFVVASVVTIVLLSVAGVVYSHKIAGPLFNLQKYLQEHTFKKRAEIPLKFREKDFFPDLAADFNMFIKEWNPAPMAKPNTSQDGEKKLKKPVA